MTKFFEIDEPLAIPQSVAACPKCGKTLIITEINEWGEDGLSTEHGFFYTCISEPDIDSDEWGEWHRWHFDMPYVYWLPLQTPVYKWLIEYCQLDDLFD